MASRPQLLDDLQDFVSLHRGHSQLFADAGKPGPNGYRLEIRCHCGVVFERWVTPEDAAIEIALMARWS